MVDKKELASGLDKVGQLISEAQKSGKKIASTELRAAKRSLGMASMELFRMKSHARKEALAMSQKREALKKSASENLITRADANKELRNIVMASTGRTNALKNIENSIQAIKKLSMELNKLAASPELEILEKGHTSSDAIKAPQGASASVEPKQAIKWKGEEAFDKMKKDEEKTSSKKTATETPKDQLMGEGKIAPELKVKEVGLKAQDSDPISQGNAEVLENGKPQESNKKGDATGNALSEATVTASKKKATFLLGRAASLIAQADKETDATKKQAMMRRATMLEKMADRITTEKPVVSADIKAKRAQIIKNIIAKRNATKKTASVEASMPIFATTERILLADGSVGTVKSASGDKVTVTVAGVDKEVLAATCKKISKGESIQVKSNSLADKIGAAINFVRGSKKTAAEGDLPGKDAKPAVAPEKDAKPASVPGSELKPAVSDGGAPTVSKSESTAVTFNQGLNKWIVVVSESEVKEFDDEASAKAFVSKGSKKNAGADVMMDSANTSTPASQEGTQKNLKGLDQSGKDYGTTSKDEKVNEDRSMIGKASKTATSMNPGLPTDSTTDKVPAGTEGIVSKIKGLTQQNKGYSSTTKDQKMDPKLGPLNASVTKVRVLEAANQRLLAALSVSEGKVMADRAVKVGAIVEAQRSEQETVLAELYQNAPAEFKAYARLISNLESNASANPTLASRGVKKVEAALASRKSTVIDGTVASTTAGSLDQGTFFDDNK